MAFVLILVLAFCGTLWTFLLDRESSFSVRVASGTVLCFAVFSYIAFLLSCLIGLNAVSIFLALLVVLLPSLWLWPRYRVLENQQWREWTGSWRHQWKSHLLNLVLLGLLFLVFNRALYEKPGGIYTGYANNLGDSAFHLQITNSFTDGQNFPPEHPAFADTRFTYHFLSDFLVAVWVKCGLLAQTATLVFNFVLTVFSVTLLRCFAWQLLRDKRAALLTPLLVLLGGGTGWCMLLNDASDSQHGILQVLSALPHTYSLLMPQTDWKTGNLLTIALVTQRSLALGLPLALTVWILWLRAIEQITLKDKGDQVQIRHNLVAAGLITGLLPLVHSPSFAISMAVGFCYALLFWRPRFWLQYAAAAIVVALPQMMWLSGASSKASSFFAWMPGWEKGDTGFVVFWLKNTGPFFLLLFAAGLWLWKSNDTTSDGAFLKERRVTFLKLYLPFFGVCFVAPNLFKLAPWSWDNIKLFQAWWIVSAPFVAWALVHMWQNRSAYFRWWRALASACAFALLASGALDVWRGLSSSQQQFPTSNPEVQIFTRDQMNIAEHIKKLPPRALILDAPVYNAPTYLTGRRVLMGYAGHVWPHGIDSGPREAEVRSFLAGEPGSEEVLTHYNVDYFVIGPQERDYLLSQNPLAQLPPASYWNRWKKVDEIGEYSIYAAR